MKAIVLYESFFGNTEKVAMAIAEGLNKNPALEAADCVELSQIELKEILKYDVLVLGSPTRGFSFCEKTKALLNDLCYQDLEGKRLATFDTRISLKTLDSKFFSFVIDKGGYASPKLCKKLLRIGARIEVAPEGFIVVDKEGPLLDGEIERAQHWGKDMISVA